uniref:Uncharacterized protein n=1 Tax=Romanomermis culicivorax TaxID=13658 RepID=A0A915I6N4_ROMCU
MAHCYVSVFNVLVSTIVIQVFFVQQVSMAGFSYVLEILGATLLPIEVSFSMNLHENVLKRLIWDKGSKPWSPCSIYADIVQYLELQHHLGVPSRLVTAPGNTGCEHGQLVERDINPTWPGIYENFNRTFN